MMFQSKSSWKQVTDAYFQNLPGSPTSLLTFLQEISFFVQSLYKYEVIS